MEGEHQPRLPVRHVIVGSVALDWIISSQGEVRRMVCGGNALYAAAGARLWSNSVAVVTRVGEDFPRQYLDNFERSGIDLSGVKSVAIPHNILSGYRYAPTGERELFSAPQEFARLGLAPQDNLEAHFFNLDWEHLDSPELNALPEDVPASYWGAHAFCINPSASTAQAEFMEILNRRGIPFAVDPGWRLAADNHHLLRDIPAYLPSREECGDFAERLLQTRSRPWLVSLGPQVLVIKNGAAGSVVYDLQAGVKHLVPAFPTTAVDPTGAGDAYVGAFTVSWTEDGNALEAALRATVSASFIVEQFDTRHCLTIDPSSAHRRVESLRGKVHTIPLLESEEIIK